MKKLSIWHVAREYDGLAEAGGLKDVTRGLAEAAVSQGHTVAMVLPFYGFMKKLALNTAPKITKNILLGGESINVIIDETVINGVTLYLIGCSYFFDKDHPYIYLDSGEGHYDSTLMNIILQKSALLLAELSTPPDIIHLHDAHVAYLPTMAKNDGGKSHLKKSAFIVTIHNAGFDYQQSSVNINEIAELTEIDTHKLRRAVINGRVIPFALAGLDATLTTVSPQYARSLEEGGSDETNGLSQFFKTHQIGVKGIYNGIKLTDWQASSAKSSLPYRYYPLVGLWAGKKKTKREFYNKIKQGFTAIQQHGWFIEGEWPLYLFHSRLVEQKGVLILVEAIQLLIQKNIKANFLIIGEGAHVFEEAIKNLTIKNSGQVTFINGYDAILIKEAIAASDFFLLPSLFEPCGLTDLYAQMLGSLPIAHRTGGLGKIDDNITGFLVDDFNAGSFSTRIEEVNELYLHYPKKIKKMARRAFISRHKHFGWPTIFKHYYEPLYRQLHDGVFKC